MGTLTIIAVSWSWEKNVCKKINYKKLFRLCLKAHCSWETCQNINKIICTQRKQELKLFFCVYIFSPLLWDSETAKYLEVALSSIGIIQSYGLHWVSISAKQIWKHLFFWFHLIYFREIWIHMVEQLYSLLNWIILNVWNVVIYFPFSCEI